MRWERRRAFGPVVGERYAYVGFVMAWMVSDMSSCNVGSLVGKEVIRRGGKAVMAGDGVVEWSRIMAWLTFDSGHVCMSRLTPLTPSILPIRLSVLSNILYRT